MLPSILLYQHTGRTTVQNRFFYPLQNLCIANVEYKDIRRGIAEMYMSEI